MEHTHQSLKEELTEKLRLWAENTTSHGVPNIVRAHNRILRVMWIIFFLASLFYCSYTILKSLVQYAQYDTTIQINLIRESPTEFPAVTICNLNPYDYYYNDNQAYINNLLSENSLFFLDFSKLLNGSTPREAIQNVFTKLKRLVATDNRKDVGFRRNLGFDLESQMLLSCTFNKITCKASQFSYFWSNDYGNCYTFNSGKDVFGNDSNVYKTSSSGPEFGLQLELLVGDPSADPQFQYKSGIFLIVHNKSTPTYLLTEGIDVATGFETYIPVTRTFYKKLPSPYSDCIESLDQYKKVSAYSQTIYGYMQELHVTNYIQELCYDLCFQDRITTKCNCSEISVPIIKNISYCVTDEQLDCLTKVNAEFSTSNIDDLCKNSCPVQCEIIKYDLSGHTATYPTKYYYDQLKFASYYYQNNDAYSIIQKAIDKFQLLEYSVIDELEYVRLNIVKVTVNYNDLVSTKIEETPSMTVETLLGVLGGQLGLFIGISFLSVIELLEITVLLIDTYRKHKQASAARINYVNTVFPGYASNPYHNYYYNFRY